MTEGTSLSGAADKDRPGATDTLMLMWKIIDATPGITREELWAKVEYQIPSGWAMRRAVRSGKWRVTPSIRSARRHVFSETLNKARRSGSIECSDGRYHTLRSIKRYYGNRDAVDETGTKAAEHLSKAQLLAVIENWVRRTNPDWPHITRAEFRAVAQIVPEWRRWIMTPPSAARRSSETNEGKDL